MQEGVFSIKTEVFQGPLDLLLSLIEKRKLLINEFSLSQITDDFIKYTEQIPDYDIGQRSEFIVVASTLLLIKSRSLLPTLSLSYEEEQSIDDLEKRLKLYQKIKDLSLHIKDRFLKNPLFLGSGTNKKEVVFSPHKSINTQSILNSLNEVIQRIPKKESPPKATIKKVISIEEMIDRLTSRVSRAMKMSFREFSGNKSPQNKEEKVEMIVSFLALLELVKQGSIIVSQMTNFSDIEMETTEVGLPRYN